MKTIRKRKGRNGGYAFYTIKRANTGLIDRGFAQRIADKYTQLKLFTIHFAPLLSTKRIKFRTRILDLIYAMPYLVLRREIVNSFKKTKNVLTSSAQQLWNIFVHLEFPLNSSIYLSAGSEREPSAEIKKESTVTNYRMPMVHKIIMSSKELTQPLAVTHHQMPVVTEQPSSIIHKPSDICNKIHASYTQLYPYKHLERVLQNQEQKIVTYQAPIVSLEPSAVSYKNLDSYIHPTGTSTISLIEDFEKPPKTSEKYPKIYRELNQNGGKSKTTINYFSESPLTKLAQLVTREPTNVLYRTYPEIEHVKSMHTETIKERMIEKEFDSKPPQVTPQIPNIDVNRLADQVYSFIERRIRIEKERRGL